MADAGSIALKFYAGHSNVSRIFRPLKSSDLIFTVPAWCGFRVIGLSFSPSLVDKVLRRILALKHTERIAWVGIGYGFFTVLNGLLILP